MAAGDFMAAGEAVVFTVVAVEAFTPAGEDFVAATAADSGAVLAEGFARAAAVGGLDVDGVAAAGDTAVAGAGAAGVMVMASAGGVLGPTGRERTMATTDTPTTILTTPTLPITPFTRTTLPILAPPTARTIAGFRDTARHLR